MKFLGTYISSNHDIGKLLHTLSKDLKKLSVQQFDDALANFVYDFQIYLTSYISYSQFFKLDIRKIKDLFSMIISPIMETFDTRILCKTIFSTIFNLALILDTNLATNLPQFLKILLSLAAIGNKILSIPIEEIINMQKDFNYLKTFHFLKKTELYPIILSCFYNPYEKIYIKIEEFSNNTQKLDTDLIITFTPHVLLLPKH